MHLSTRKNVLVLVVAGALLFLLSGIGQDSGYWKSGPSWLGAIGWFGFLICLLLLVVAGVMALTERLRHGGHHGGSLPH
ncbi:MAG: hypothetical protein WCD35_13895 [Mycobacteriales bacterium]